MAVRVRKLARELNRGPDEVIGLLHAIGMERYRSADDMLPDPTAEAVRRAIRDGVAPVPVAVIDRPTAKAIEVDEAPDLMSRLVPGVSRGGKAPIAARPQPVPAPIARAKESPAPRPENTRVIEAERQAVAAERAALEAERDALRRDHGGLGEREEALAEERARLEAEWSTLAEERVNVAREREAVARERSETARDRAAAIPPLRGSGRSLADLLTARGLRGLDEHERAIGALASARMLGDLLGRLRVDEVELVDRFLRERLVLVAGEAPAGVGAAAVTVAPDRAEIPDAAGLTKAIARLGEALLLAGLRRLLIIGGRPAWQKLLRSGLDARLEVRFLPAAPRTRADAEQDVQRTDVVALWGVSSDNGAREVYGQTRAIVVHIDHDGIPALITAISAAVSG